MWWLSMYNAGIDGSAVGADPETTQRRTRELALWREVPVRRLVCTMLANCLHTSFPRMKLFP